MDVRSSGCDCGGVLKRAGWMLLQCRDCGALFEVFPDGSILPSPFSENASRAETPVQRETEDDAGV
jgi:hypothetical protein